MSVLFSGTTSIKRKDLLQIAKSRLFWYTDTVKLKIVKHPTIKGVLQLLHDDTKYCPPYENIYISIS